MARKKPAAATGAQAPAATAEQQGNLPAASTTTVAPTAVAAAPGSTDAAGNAEQTTQAPGADAAPTALDSAASTTGQDAQLDPAADAMATAVISQSEPTALIAGAVEATAKTYPSTVAPGIDPLLQALAVLDDDGEVEGLWITAIPEQGFRRCGFRFTREGLAIALSALTEQQLEQLESEPNLKVERGAFSGLVE